MRILFVASEALPFAKTGGLADVVEALPRALVKLGHEVAVFLPRYRGIKTGSEVMKSMTIQQGQRLRFPAIANGTITRGVRYFFLDDPAYFDRAGIYGEDNKDYPDNAERFTEFCRAAIEVAKHVWPPDLIHCHDWQTGMMPVLMRTSYGDDPAIRNIPLVFTIHNLGYQGIFPRAALDAAGIPRELFFPGGIEFFGNLNFLKGGLIYSDFLTTVSPKYAQEIQTPEYGFGLDGVVRGRAERLTGILNGVDYSVWSPDVDDLIAEKYSAKDFKGKETCKKDLLKEFGLAAENAERPLIGIVSRFADQKGFDLLAEVADELLEEDLALVALGSGDPAHEMLFHKLQERHPERVAV